MLKQNEIAMLLNGLPLGLSYKKYLSNKPVTLNRPIGLALGETERRLIRVLSTVVDAINDKLYIEKTVVTDTQLQTTLEQWKQSIHWNLVERELYKYAIRDGRSYALVSWKNGVPRIDVKEVFDGSVGAFVIYDDNVPALGINTWYIGKRRYLDVYYADRIEKYLLDESAEEWSKRKDSKDEAWPIDFTDNNNSPLGIPMIEYTIGDSDLADGAVQIQHDINTVIMDQLAIDRTMGYPLRYMSGTVNPSIITNVLGQAVISASGQPYTRSLELPPGSIYPLSEGTTLAQLDSAKPDRTVFDMLLHLLTIVTKVPTFYFTGENLPSGVALIQAESPLNSLVENHQAYLTPAVVSTVQMMVRLSNTFAGTAFDVGIIEITWASPEVYTQDLQMDMQKTETLIITQQVSAGVRSIDSAVRILNPTWDESQVQAEVARLTASTL